ncbi:hypothetical protein OG763_21855 [Streptomyces sp. NBC_01230]|uniref:hypothetical protein n=1 Tax=unclassified Streptomyces TaxID=2593676 RepID=UPI002E130A53|nr:hypothetical protein OG763_21855 [Streptomyces sp. NBC_01230]
MITQGVKVTARCDACGGVLILDVGQYIDHGQLWWGTEGACTACPNGWCEQDTGGATPEEIRNALLVEHGPAQLRLADDASSLVPVLRVLREMLRLPLGQARVMASALQETGLVGTLVEMELIADGLQHRSVATTIETLAD